MRYIDKKESPLLFEQWKAQNEEEIVEKIANPEISSSTIWNFFRDFQFQTIDGDSGNGNLYNYLKDQLLAEQGGTCCYCGKRIHAGPNTIIEHLHPKSKHRDLIFEYTNLLASCDGGSKRIVHIVEVDEALESIALKYGVSVEHLEDVYVNVDELELFRRKHDIENLELGDRLVIFRKTRGKELHCDAKKASMEVNLHPLMSNCAGLIAYDRIDGEILVDESYKKSIEQYLGLNSNRYLKQLRLNAIATANQYIDFLMQDFADDPIGLKGNLEKLMNRLDQVDANSNSMLEPFCFVIRWALKN